MSDPREVAGVRVAVSAPGVTGECPDLLCTGDRWLLVADLGGTVRGVTGEGPLLGWAPAQLAGRRIWELVDATHLPNPLEWHLDPAPVVVRLRTASGEWASVRISAAPLVDAAGARSGTVLTVSADVVDEALDTHLRAAQRMEVVGLFTSGIAHDFNNLVSVVQSYATMLRATASPGSRVARDLDEILDASRRAALLTRRLLAFCTPSERTVTTLVDVGRAIQDIHQMLARMLGDAVLVHIEVDPDATVLAEQGQIEQILMNLVVNARDAMPVGGRLDLVARHVVLGAEVANWLRIAPGPHVQIVVRDSGTGMTPTTLDRIFEPYFTTKTVQRGTGLGLSVIRRVVGELGGAVDVESVPGAGSTFRVYLPYTAPPADRGWGPTGGVVLVVDDDRAIRGIVERILAEAGHRVESFADGPSAMSWALAHGETARVLLVDRVLKEVSGPQLVDALRRWCPDARVVYMSGYPDGLEATGEVALQKPFDHETLLAAIRGESLKLPGRGQP
jgi:two-component system, cell cycle sensor histidine kinase and response regulator CckA